VKPLLDPIRKRHSQEMNGVLGADGTRSFMTIVRQLPDQRRTLSEN